MQDASGAGLLVMIHFIRNGWKSTVFVVREVMMQGGGAAGHDSCCPKRTEKRCIRRARCITGSLGYKRTRMYNRICEAIVVLNGTVMQKLDASRIMVCGGELVTGQVRSAAKQPLVEALDSCCEDNKNS